MKKSFLFIFSAALMLAACNTPKATDETPTSPADKVLVRDFFPDVANNIPVTEVTRGKFPIIDMHSHDYVESAEQIAKWVETMDAVGVEHTAIMHCSWIGRPFDEVVELYEPWKDRFRFWCCFDYTGIDSPEWPAQGIAALERCKQMGATGVGELGDKGEGDTYARPADGKDIHIDDPRVQPLIRRAGELRMPISIHIAEPTKRPWP